SAVEYVDATIGIQADTANSTNNFFLQYVYDGVPATHVPDSGTVILFTRVITDVAEAPSETGSLKVIGRTVLAKDGVIYDASGRKVGEVRGRYLLPSPGIYFVRTEGRTYRILVR
ncbi:MAG: hypothetical protein GXO39_00825, partial [Thermotogae bacterium]|nr:hypothetical protein [Thermotogota bacterium]